jgi:hypothetical protein
MAQKKNKEIKDKDTALNQSSKSISNTEQNLKLINEKLNELINEVEEIDNNYSDNDDSLNTEVEFYLDKKYIGTVYNFLDIPSENETLSLEFTHEFIHGEDDTVKYIMQYFPKDISQKPNERPFKFKFTVQSVISGFFYHADTFSGGNSYYVNLLPKLN